MALARFGVSVDADLLERFDAFAQKHGLRNRSAALEAAMRAMLVAQGFGDERADAWATVSLVYDHHQRELAGRITGVQHAHHGEVVASMHVHMTHDLCLETIAVKGKPGEFRALADELGREKGVHVCTVTPASAAKPAAKTAAAKKKHAGVHRH